MEFQKNYFEPDLNIIGNQETLSSLMESRSCSQGKGKLFFNSLISFITCIFVSFQQNIRVFLYLFNKAKRNIKEILEMKEGRIYETKLKSVIEFDRRTWVKNSIPVRFPFPSFRNLEGIVLPEPKIPKVDFGRIILERRSCRDFSDEHLDLETLSSLLFLAFGISKWDDGFPLRTFPSAGALQPVEVFIYAKKIKGLETGIYYYNFLKHSLYSKKIGDFSKELYRISLSQEHVFSAPLVIIITSLWIRSAWKYGERGYKYSILDCGFAGENLYLSAEALGLKTCAVGAFYDEELAELLEIDISCEIPLLLMPVGKPQKNY